MAIPEKKVLPGEFLDLTDEQLDELSIITPMDIEKAKQLWRNTAPPEFKTLLDAETTLAPARSAGVEDQEQS